MEDGDLAELYIEDPNNERTLGDIYVGKVRRTMPSIQAAFIDIGQKQDAFLHFSDLSDNLPLWLDLLKQDRPSIRDISRKSELPQTAHKKAVPRGDDADNDTSDSSKSKSNPKEKKGHREGSINPQQYLKRETPILVKIVKEPISAKGSRVSTDISLAGRFLVLVPLANYVAVSKKIYSYKERRRLRALAQSLLPEGFGVIVRTVAEGKKAKELDTDLRLLVDKWRKLEKKLEEKKQPPALVHEDVNMASSIIRDLFSDDYDRILIDNPKLYRNVKNYIQAIAPHMVPNVQHYTGKKHIYQYSRIAHEVNQIFESRVDLPSGGYLFIENTEAMHVIDVNSGRAGKGLSQEQNSLKVDIEAAKLIAKQIRLRDLGGIIVVDFIDLREEQNRRKVYNQLRKEFRKDRAVTKVLPMSDFGLVEITRQRMRPSITKTFSETHTELPESAPTAAITDAPKRKASRGVTPDINIFLEKIEKWVIKSRKVYNKSVIGIRIHPFTATYLRRGIIAIPTKWFLKHRVRVRIETDDSLDPFAFRVFDPTTGKDLKKPPRKGTRQRPQGRKPKDAQPGNENRKEKPANQSTQPSSRSSDNDQDKAKPTQRGTQKSSSQRSSRSSASNRGRGQRNQKQNTADRNTTASNESQQSATDASRPDNANPKRNPSRGSRSQSGRRNDPKKRAVQNSTEETIGKTPKPVPQEPDRPAAATESSTPAKGRSTSNKPASKPSAPEKAKAAKDKPVPKSSAPKTDAPKPDAPKKTGNSDTKPARELDAKIARTEFKSTIRSQKAPETPEPVKKEALPDDKSASSAD